MIDEREMFEELRGGLIEALRTYRNNNAYERVMGVAICFDESFVSSYLAISTESGRRKYIGDKRGLESDYKFDPQNWTSVGSNELFDRFCRNMYMLYEESSDYDNDENWHSEYQSRVYLLSVRVLESLIFDGQLSNVQTLGDTFYTVWVSDSEITNMKGRACSKRLNNPEVHKQFTRWLDVAHCK